MFEKDDIYKTITPEMFDIRGNKSGNNFSKGQMRGQKPYDPPLGWTGHGLRVLDCYDDGDNRWLGNKNTKGEWWVAYHGTSIKYVVSILLNGLKSGKGQHYSNQVDINNHIIGKGVYVTPKIQIAEQYSLRKPFNGYVCVLMCRVNPENVRIPINNNDYWIVNGNNKDVRPYRILIKKITNNF